jgi:CubicO group peptidase (beta-lactamase class C family)
MSERHNGDTDDGGWRAAAAALAVLALAGSLSSCASPAVTRDTGRIDEFVRSEMARQKIPGVAIAVIRGGEVVRSQGYGFANVELKSPVTTETIFQSGSMGKQFTAAAVMLLVQDGKLRLDDPIATYLPGTPPAFQAITVRHLLTHTSGIPDYTTSDFDYRRDYTEDDLLKMAFAQKLEFAPGAR